MMVSLPWCFRCKEHHELGDCPQDEIAREINAVKTESVPAEYLRLLPSAISPAPPKIPAFIDEASPPEQHAGAKYAMPRVTTGLMTKGMMAAGAVIERNGRSDEQLAVDVGVGITLIRVCKMILERRPSMLPKIAIGELSVWEVKKKIQAGTR